jgi:5'-nucleotidase
MRLLLTNDDGIDAAGLEALFNAATGFGDLVTAAPVDAHSGCGHRVTTTQPIRILTLAASRYAVHGTPADCVRVGLHSLAPDVEWILAGVNEGGNLGADVHHSGTVAAVREAVLHGKRGIAVSHYHKRGRDIDWVRAARWVQPLLERLLKQPCEPGTFWNINLPHLAANAADPEVIFCALEAAPLPLSFRLEGELLHYNGNYHERARTKGSDVDVCFSGNIAVTRVSLY